MKIKLRNDITLCYNEQRSIFELYTKIGDEEVLYKGGYKTFTELKIDNNDIVEILTENQLIRFILLVHKINVRMKYMADCKEIDREIREIYNKLQDEFLSTTPP